MRRSFNESERDAIYRSAGGHCQACGVELQPGWHADHIVPWSKGGVTDVINGQALCPTCNLAKSKTLPFKLREWQKLALKEFANGNQDFLAVACPGAGKTTFALEAARRLLNAGAIERIWIVVPTSHLKRQWAVAGTRFGIDLDPDFRNVQLRVANDYQGAVVTYHQVASDYYFHRQQARTRCLVIFDEIHHAADDLAWGTALAQAYDQDSCRRLALSGTPFRTDRGPIPFVTYDALGRVQPDYEYDYGKALYDGVVRPIEFPALDSEVRWSRASEVRDAYLSEASDEVLADALKAALRPDGDWIPSVLSVANAQLTQARMETPDAAGLLLASDKRDARAYAKILERITGEVPVVVLNDVENASKQIEEFTKGTSRWIVAVRMVSEGVDIPRLLVGVYATTYRTEMFFRQVVGRFVRRRNEDDVMSATLFIPSIEPLLRYATGVEQTVDQALNLESGEDAPRLEREAVVEVSEYEALGSSEAALHATVRSGDAFSPEQLEMAQRLLAEHQFPPSTTPSMLLRLMDSAKIAISTTQPPEKPTIQQETLVDTKDRKKQAIKRLVNRLALMRKKGGFAKNAHSAIHIDLNKACAEESIKEATLKSLEYRIALLNRWIEREASHAS